MHVIKLNVGEKSKHLKFDQCGSNDEKKTTIFMFCFIFQVTDTKTRVWSMNYMFCLLHFADMQYDLMIQQTVVMISFEV